MKSNFRIIVLVIGMVVLHKVVSGQSAKDFRINEILIKNATNYEDDYGTRSAWIEIFNTAYNKVNIGGCYITDDINNPLKYKIPRNDPNTVIASRFFTVFWADGITTHGTFHLNFVLDSTSRFIALFDADGRTLIDKASIHSMAENISYGRDVDGTGNWVELEKTTPKATNYTGDIISSGQRFAGSDPIGIGMTLVAMTVVFIALILLYTIFRMIGKFNIRLQQKRVEMYAAKEGKAVIHEEISGEVFAAISAALYFYETQIHDHESTILTINRVAKSYSPWSSKIYGLRNSIHKEPSRIEVKR